MTDSSRPSTQETFSFPAQPRDVAALLKSAAGTRKLTSLYATDHPSLAGTLESLMDSLNAFLRERERVTIVFAKDIIIVNDCAYASSSESRELYSRLRTRGTMAVSFIHPVSKQDIAEFLAFLNVAPKTVRQHQGASSYLREQAVTHIILTESVYSNQEEDETEEQPARSTASPVVAVRVIGAAIEWLCKQEDDEEMPQLPIAEILSDPESAARLIREAVTRLHASRSDYSKRELAGEVVNNLKEISDTDQEGWDNSTPRIRKAMSKLPREMLPLIMGVAKRDDEEDPGGVTIQTEEIEASASKAIAAIGSRTDNPAEWLDVDTDGLSRLFSARPAGRLSSWDSELQPSSILASCAMTYESLLAWESNTKEHARIARAQALMISHAIDIEDFDVAVMAAGTLANEYAAHGKEWRALNVRAALQSIDISVPKAIVQHALDGGSYRAKEVASLLVEVLPDLALAFINLLGTDKDAFGQSLKIGLVRAEQSALPALSQMLRFGEVHARLAAAEVLAAIGSAQAFQELSEAMSKAEPAFAVSALGILPAGCAYYSRICADALQNRSVEVRTAALAALARAGDHTALPAVLELLQGPGSRRLQPPERIAAIGVVGRLGCSSEAECLRRIAERRVFFGRRKYEAVRAAAVQACADVARREEKRAA